MLYPFQAPPEARPPQGGQQCRPRFGRGLARPPPFPFTAFVMAAALQYSRLRLLSIIAATRMLRFVMVGALAIRFGRGILGWAKLTVVQDLLVGLIVVCIAASMLSVYGWIESSGGGKS